MISPRETRRTPAPPLTLHDIPTYKKGYKGLNNTTEIRYQRDWARQHQLEGDGLLPLLYDHMYKSDKTREHRLRGVAIPDTVIYEHNFPRAWYAYDAKSQEIVKRPGKMLESHSIYDFFSEEEPGCDIVAQFFSKLSMAPKERPTPRRSRYSSTARSTTQPQPPGESGGRSPRAASARDRDMEVSDENGASVEFFTKETLHQFIHNQKAKPDGVLQKFVLPKGQISTMYNYTMQAVWSPLVTLVYKRTCKHRLSDRTGGTLNERASTFDGPPHYSVESLVAQSTKDDINSACRRIVQHFALTEHKPITRMVLYFKTDAKDRLQVLWASSVRVGGDKLNPNYLRVPLHLAIKVDNASSGNKDDVSRDTRLLMDVLNQDILMYQMTGDLVFAGKCCETITHKHVNNLFELTSAPAGSTPRVRSLTEKKSLLTDLQDSSYTEEALNALVVPPVVGARPSTALVPKPPGKDHFYVGDRPPFLIKYRPPESVPVISPRHPLHDAYVELYGAGQKTASDAEGGGRREKANIEATKAGSRGEGQLTTAERMARRTKKQLLLGALVAVVEDMIYRAYTTTLDNGRISARVSVELDPLLVNCLDQRQLHYLMTLLRLEPDAAGNEAEDKFIRLQKEEAAALEMAGRRTLIGYDTLPILALGHVTAESIGECKKELRVHPDTLASSGPSRGLACDDSGSDGVWVTETPAPQAPLFSEEEPPISYYAGMRLTVAVGTLGRGYRRDRPIAQLTRDAKDYLSFLLTPRPQEDGDTSEDILARHESAGDAQPLATASKGPTPPTTGSAQESRRGRRPSISASESAKCTPSGEPAVEDPKREAEALTTGQDEDDVTSRDEAPAHVNALVREDISTRDKDKDIASERDKDNEIVSEGDSTFAHEKDKAPVHDNALDRGDTSSRDRDTVSEHDKDRDIASLQENTSDHDASDKDNASNCDIASEHIIHKDTASEKYTSDHASEKDKASFHDDNALDRGDISSRDRDTASEYDKDEDIASAHESTSDRGSHEASDKDKDTATQEDTSAQNNASDKDKASESYSSDNDKDTTSTRNPSEHDIDAAAGQGESSTPDNNNQGNEGQGEKTLAEGSPANEESSTDGANSSKANEGPDRPTWLDDD